MNQANYPNNVVPSARALKRGRMELFGSNHQHGMTTSTYPRRQQLQRRPVFFKSHSASDAIFSSRHPSPPDQYSSNSRARGLYYMPTPKRSKSVGSSAAAVGAVDDYCYHDQRPQASYPAIVTPSRESYAYPPLQHQQYCDNRCYYGKNGSTTNTIFLDSGPFLSQHVKSTMNQEERFPTKTSTVTSDKIDYHPFHNGAQQVTPSSSCDYGDSLRSLPRLDQQTYSPEDVEEEPLLQSSSIPDLFEPYNILEEDNDDSVFPDIIEPYEVHCYPDDSTSDFLANSFAPDNVQSTFNDDAVNADYCNMMKISGSDSSFVHLNQISSAVHCQKGLLLPKEHEMKISYPTVKNEDEGIALATTTPKNDTRDAVSTNNGQGRFRDFHEKKWNDHLEELREFKKRHGHCLVPHTFPENQSLARWVKRQRRQYKLMQEGDESSTMTQARAELLNREGFVWDSHEVVWRERYEQLVRYKEQNGHCRVPSYCKDNPQLATWVKCQRRQYKLFWEGKRSSMSVERTQLLEDIGFVWEVRPDKCLKSKDDSLKKLADILNDL